MKVSRMRGHAIIKCITEHSSEQWFPRIPKYQLKTSVITVTGSKHIVTFHLMCALVIVKSMSPILGGSHQLKMPEDLNAFVVSEFCLSQYFTGVPS